MVNILVPTDFSPLSKVAVRYAMKMANTMNGNVTLLHVLTDIVQPTRSSMRLRLQSLQKELLAIAEQEFKPVIEEAAKLNKTKYPVKHKIQLGQSFNDTVKRCAKKYRSGLIIMGTKGASGLKKYVMGTSTASVMEISHIPVLAVPEEASFKSLKNVVFATNLQHLETELKALLPYLKVFDATLHVVHALPKGKDPVVIEENIKKLLKKVDCRESTVTIVRSKTAEDAIRDAVKTLKPDMLTMFTHEHGFIDKLFNRSITKKMAFQANVPLLAFKR